MRVAIKEHQAKIRDLILVLRHFGHEITPWPADVLLTDSDSYALHDLIDRYADAGAKVFVYPHGAPMYVSVDGIYPPYRRVTGQLVFGPGQAEVLRRMGYPGEIHVIGWFYCPTKPFRGTGEVREVLYAPAHPISTGLTDPLVRHNRAAFEQLLAVPDIRITVRHIDAVEDNGLWIEPGVEYVRGQLDNAWTQIDASDVVVSYRGTFPSMAVARGCPTIMYGGDDPPTSLDDPNIPLREGLRFEHYRELLRYPLQMGDAPMAELLARAATGDERTARWRELFIGEELSPAAFARQFEDAVSGPGLDARGFVVVCGARQALADPAIVAAHAERFAAGDDATLVLWEPGEDPEALLARLLEALGAAGIDPGSLPDVTIETEAAPALMAARAKAVLGPGLGGPFGWLPSYASAEAGALRAQAEDHWAAVAALAARATDDAARGFGNA